jgi:hypothetical protein
MGGDIESEALRQHRLFVVDHAVAAMISKP